MKFLILFLLSLMTLSGLAQSLQLDYDLRHTVDPRKNLKNFPTIYFEYFKEQDSGKAFIKPGAFLFKMEANLNGLGTNAGKMYIQATQTLRFWRPKVFLHLSYSGGLGVTEPKQYSYYILNTYSAGIAYPFAWLGGYYSFVLDYRYAPYTKPSSDFLATVYFYRGLFHYRMEILGDVNVWTENKNHGDPVDDPAHGKNIFLFAEPQIWWRIGKGIYAGSKINIYYNVNVIDRHLEIYPSFGLKWKLE